MTPTNETTKKIAALNDLARTAMGVTGPVLMTPGIQALTPAEQSAIRERVEKFYSFTKDNDPYGEHDFGAFDHCPPDVCGTGGHSSEWQK
jgi:hypothetical protein